MRMYSAKEVLDFFPQLKVVFLSELKIMVYLVILDLRSPC